MSGSPSGLKRTKNEKTISNLTFNDYNLGHRETPAGYSPDPTQIGSVPATEIKIGKHMPVMVSNWSGSPIFVTVGDQGLAVADITNGVAVLDGAQVVINTGQYKYIRFSGAAATAQYAVAQDDALHEN